MINRRIYLAFLLFLMLPGSLLFAQGKWTQRSARISIDGNSTMHKWSSAVNKVSMTADVEMADGVIKKINAGTVKMETKSIKSHKDSDIMDDRTHETLKADKFPSISYEYTNTLSADAAGNFKINGKLTLAGVTKPLELNLKITTLTDGAIMLKGSKTFNMSTFGIKPPAFLAGTLKVEDAVTISFEVILKNQ